MADLMLAHQFLVTATFTGFDNSTLTLTFAGSDGGEFTTEIGSIRPGGMGKTVKLPGLDDTGELTLTKPFDRTADPANLVWLKANRGCHVDFKKQPLGRNKLPVGTATSEPGILASVVGPNADADSNDSPTLSVTVGVTEPD